MGEPKLMSLRLRHTAGTLRMRVEFDLGAPWSVLFGPSGSGKSTVLRAVAGVLQARESRIVLGEAASGGQRVLDDTAAGVFVPVHQRPVRSAAQAARLFRGMTVRANVCFGVAGASRRVEAAGGVVEEAMALLRIGHLAGRRPEELSGGERQRVSVARAVASVTALDAARPRMLLLDEPFAGLDTKLRDEIAAALREWLRLRRVPVLSVSHDVAECFLLGAEVLRMEDGQIAAQGMAGVVLGQERERVLRSLGA